MAYTILNTDGSTLLLLADNTVDKSTTSISLIGKNVNSYGQYFNNNLIKLLANFASTSSAPPISPLTGQLWYDTSAHRLKIYDNGFKAVSGSLISGSEPDNLSLGDLWFDSSSQQLNLFTANGSFIIGPAFPQDAGSTGWILPVSPIRDDSGNARNITILSNFGTILGLVSNQEFTLTPDDSDEYFNTPNAVAVNGLTIIGDIKATGQITNNYLTFTVDIDKLTPSTNDISSFTDRIAQEIQILQLLEKTFPVEANSVTDEVGVPLGAEARVLCGYTEPSPAGYQIRRYNVVPVAPDGRRWQQNNVYQNGTSNIVP